MTIHFEIDKTVAVMTIDRPEVSNAIDGPTGKKLAELFRQFDQDPALSVAVLTGANDIFCAGNDLKSMQSSDVSTRIPIKAEGDAPCGVSRLLLGKPVIAAIEGYAVAGGLEVACWCDMRISGETAKFGVYCRRWGIPLMDGGTVRLARLIGHSHAMDMIMTGRGVEADEALRMGLVNRVVPKGSALKEALKIAHQIAALPQAALRSDRLSAYQQWDLDLPQAMQNEFSHGLATISTGEMIEGLKQFSEGEWREKAPA